MNMMEISTASRPDNLLVALVFDKETKTHVNTIVGHYSEFLSNVNLLNNLWENQLYQDENGFFIVLLHNCVRKRASFDKMYNYCFLQIGLQIDLRNVFNDLDRVLDAYTMVNDIGKPIYPVLARIKQDVIKFKYNLNRRRREYNLVSVSAPNSVASWEFGSYLRNVAPCHRV